MPDRFRMLRGRLLAMGVDQPFLGREILKGHCYISERMNSKRPWTLDDMYAICRLLDIPSEELHIYFPPAAEKTKNQRRKVV